MTSEVSITLDIPAKTIDILKLLQYQNSVLDYKLNKAARTITLTGYVTEITDIEEVWDTLPIIDDYLRKEE